MNARFPAGLPSCWLRPTVLVDWQYAGLPKTEREPAAVWGRSPTTLRCRGRGIRGTMPGCGHWSPAWRFWMALCGPKEAGDTAQSSQNTSVLKRPERRFLLQI